MNYWEWQQLLTAGNFLYLKRIKYQFPQGLVDAYNKFEVNDDKIWVRFWLERQEKEERRVEEEDE